MNIRNFFQKCKKSTQTFKLHRIYVILNIIDMLYIIFDQMISKIYNLE